MIDFMKSNFSDRMLVVRYAVSGVVGLGTNLGVMYFATEILGIWYMWSAAIALTASFLVAFILQKYWTFKETTKDKIRSQAASYLAIAIGGMFFDMAALYVFVDVFGLWYFGSQVVIMGFIALASFLLNRNLTFKKRTGEFA